MSDPRRVLRLLEAAAHLCQVEADLTAAGYPELVARLEDIRAIIDLEIARLAPDNSADLDPYRPESYHHSAQRRAPPAMKSM